MSVLRYRPAPDSSWYHYLYGPRRDGTEGWIILPDNAPLETDHLGRMKSAILGLEAPNASDFSLSVVNLSLGEAGLCPGRGGVAILLHFLLTDSQGRTHRFVHALTCYGRGLDRTILHNTIWTFLRRVTRGRQHPERPIDRYFAAYQETRGRSEAFLILDRYLRRIEPFDFVPVQEPCRELLLEDGGIWPDVLDVTSTSETWEEVIQGISAISAALYDSVLPWAALTTSLTLPGEREGLIIRFLARPQLLKHDHPLIILEDLDADRAAVALLPVIEQEITQTVARTPGGMPIIPDFVDEQREPTEQAGGPPPPPMLLDEPDTITDDVIDLSAPMATPFASSEDDDGLGEPELTADVVMVSPAVLRPPRPKVAPKPLPPPAAPPPAHSWRGRSVAFGVAAAALLVSAVIAMRSDATEHQQQGLEMIPPRIDPAADPLVEAPAGTVDERELVSLAWVSPEGDASGVWLKKEPVGQPVYLAGREPFAPGEYTVIAQFSPEGASRDTVRVTLAPDDSVRIRCEAQTGRCRVRR